MDGAVVQLRPLRAAQTQGAWVTTGFVRMMVTELEIAAADIDDDEVSIYVHDLRLAVELLGGALSRVRRPEEPDA